MNDKCKTLFNSTENNLLNCESTYRNQLTNVINNAYDISRLFCFKGKNNEFCPISKIFQKAKTVGESVTGDSFYSFSLLHNYCLDDVCAQYIDESFIGIYALYNIGLISEENIMSSLKYIRDFIESPDCNKIRKNYGHVETMIDVNSETSINESSSSKNIIFSWNLLFTIMIIIIHINFIS
ncbi:hypothetical protein BCR32DRAFT_329242 [Anaeromyces robustus]|uniref:Uncharacterized protein n=1 Tax=Anaeromyces robustus TaxID=1754192 RepID=A0A1Y1WTH8_9FUNG|nr:hypothetical protein BCR32DRAFT_329242 [Anaeromyces robustus]|eukprot:ORX76695.1 hypothetical protein BCR32DRAFT_329242 [Anaeromyces robustus]